MRRVKKNKTISFRLTDEQWQQLEGMVALTQGTPHDWCRNLALDTLKKQNESLSKNEQLIYEELARVRYLVGYGFGLLAGNQLTPQEWETKRLNADQSGAEIARVLLDKHSASKQA